MIADIGFLIAVIGLWGLAIEFRFLSIAGKVATVCVMVVVLALALANVAASAVQ